MKTGWSRLRHPILIAGVCLAVGLVLAHQAGLRLNTTHSIPLGLYRMADDPIEKGGYVLFCQRSCNTPQLWSLNSPHPLTEEGDDGA